MPINNLNIFIYLLSATCQASEPYHEVCPREATFARWTDRQVGIKKNAGTLGAAHAKTIM